MEICGRKKVVGDPASPARDPHRGNRYRDDHIRSMGLKIEIPEFTGKVHQDDFIDWLSTIEWVFNVWDILDKLKLKLVAIKLRKYASLWWDHAKFLPENHRQEAFLDYHNMSQWNMTAKEVINEFDKLRMRCDVVEEEEQVVARFLGVLKPEIAVLRVLIKIAIETALFGEPVRAKFKTPYILRCGQRASQRNKYAWHLFCGNKFLRRIGFKFEWSLGNGPTVKTHPFSMSPVIMETRGGKKSVTEPAPPARDPRNRAPAITTKLADRDDPIHSLGLKIEIPEFTCKVHPDDLINWLSTVERVFDRRRIKGKSKVETLEKMKKLMKAKFLPENHHQEAFLDYHNLSQQNMTVEEVINEFDKLRMRCDVVKEEEEQVVAWFLGVLKPEIDDNAKSKGSTSCFTPPTRTAPPIAPKVTTLTTSTAGNTKERVVNAPRCYKCSGLGNFAHDCSNLKTLAFVPDDACLIYDTNAEPEVDELGDELGGRFTWTSKAAMAFDILKAKVIEAHVLALPNFDEVFQVEWDASRVGIGGVLSGLAGHFGRDKTLALLRERFSKPNMEHEVNRLLKRCHTCYIPKTHSSNAGLYTPLSVPVSPWEDVSLDFVLGLPRTQRAKDSIMVVVVLSKMAHFVPCSKMFDANQVARLYFVEIVKFRGVPKTLTSDRDVKFTEVVNQRLGNLLCNLIGDNAKEWDLILPQAKFAYNRSVNRTTGKSPFVVVYGWNPITLLDLVRIPEVGRFSEEGADQSEQIKELHWSVQEQIIQHNKQYKEHADKRQKQDLYQEGDLVWIHLRKERFLAGRFGKLKPRGDDPFHLLPYKGDSDDEPDLWSSLFQKGEDDADAVNITNTLGTYFAITNFCDGLG
nr:hypothetical protein [Tanacetum cinerariifolium]